MMEPIPFIDLDAQRRRLGSRLKAAIFSVVAEGQYILGPQVAAFEQQLARFGGAAHAIACANGTDAIALGLIALGVGAGDAVLVPSFTFASTAEAVAWLGATPIFVDIDETSYTIDPAGVAAGLAAATAVGLTPKALIAVDLFGQPSDYPMLEALCERHGLALVCDAAQSFGASIEGRPVGSIGALTTTSFFPAKPLGCYGDGGAVLTNDPEVAATLRSLHVHGRGADKYDNVRIGMNSRLDTIQAAILIEKLAIFPDEIERRQRVAVRYAEALAGVAVVPVVREGCRSVWAQFVIRVAPEQRAAFMADLKRQGIPTAIYYPIPLHRQTAYRRYPMAGVSLPISDRVASEVVALPMHPYLDEVVQDRIVAAARASLALT